MRLQISRTKNAASLYIVKSTYDKNGKRSNMIVEKLGTEAELSKLHPDPIAWGKQRAEELTRLEKEAMQSISVEYHPASRMEKGQKALYNGGYLFLQSLYYEYGIDKICKEITKKYKFEYDLNSILSRLLYGRILFPGSKMSTMEESKQLLEAPNFELHHIYRALEVIAKEDSFIQSELYKNSLQVGKRNDSVLYYDCTNFFFEIEEESGIRQYGPSKEHRPNPIVQMGLFMDGDGVPLTFSITPGNTNEQQTLKPLEQQIISEFGKKKFIVCTDAGLSSTANRKFNNIQGRAFITVQSLKKMKEYQKEWALKRTGWKLKGSNTEYNLDEVDANRDEFYDKVFYKEEWFLEDGLEQRFIVTYSLKYKEYLQRIRERQIQRAEKSITTGSVGKHRANDPKRFVGQFYFTDDGEVAEHKAYTVDEKKIREEEMFDGYYCTATNLEDPVEEILKVNQRRWEIEESFRIMKSEFKARPVFLSRNDRIKAHFITCFLALFLYRQLEKRLGEKFTTKEITSCLKNMTFHEVPREGYIPAYERTDLTDVLHASFGFSTDYEFIPLSNLRKIFRHTKRNETLCKN